jgi:hypothetical protein
VDVMAKDSADPEVSFEAHDTSCRLALLIPLCKCSRLFIDLQEQIAAMETKVKSLPLGKSKIDQAMDLSKLKDQLVAKKQQLMA